MKVFLAALVLFLIAFAGLAAGLLCKRRGLRGGCGSASAGDGRDCQCKAAGAPGRRAQDQRPSREEDRPEF